MKYRIALYVVLLMGALWLLAVNSGFANRARDRLAYADLIAQRGNESDPSRPIMLVQYDSEDPLVPAGATILLGDSIAFKAPYAGRCVANRGIGGERSDQLLANLARWPSLRRAGAVVIAIGTNDVWQHRPAGLGQRVAAMVERIAAPTFVLGLSAKLRGVPEANRALRRACRGRCTFIEPTDEVASDGIHLSPVGYARLAAQLPEFPGEVEVRPVGIRHISVQQFAVCKGIYRELASHRSFGFAPYEHNQLIHSNSSLQILRI